MTLEATLKDDMKTAMKARDQVRLGTVRMLLADLKNETIARGKPLSEGDELALLAKHKKQRVEAAAAFRKGGRDDLADNEEAELSVIVGYLPEQLEEDEVALIVAEIIGSVGATGRRDMGRVMGQLMPRIKGRFDGGQAKGIVMALLDKAAAG